MKNWYRIAKDLSKVAQIWAYEEAEDDVDEYSGERNFASKIREMYELEYKWSMMGSRGFVGLPKRQENILRQLEMALVNVMEQVKDQLIETIGKWLNRHALLSPETWAKGRADDALEIEEDTGFDLKIHFENMISEYARYAFGNGSFRSNTPMEQTFYTMLNTALQNIESYPALKKFIEDGYLPDYKEMEKNDASYDLESFNTNHDVEFADEGAAHDWIDENFSLDNIDLDAGVIFGGDMESFSAALDNWGVGDKIIQEFYQNQVFPVWHRHWASQGIEETRKTVEKIYADLQSSSSSNAGNMIARVNMGLNVAHQTGDMIDYLEEDTNSENLKSVLDEATEGVNVERFNEELRMVGVQI